LQFNEKAPDFVAPITNDTINKRIAEERPSRREQILREEVR